MEADTSTGKSESTRAGARSRFLDGDTHPSVSVAPLTATHALFLTLPERVVWEYIGMASQLVDDELRVPLMRDRLQFYREWRGRDDRATPSEYSRAIDRFIDAGLLREVGESYGGKISYVLTRRWEDLHIIPIHRRVAIFFSATLVQSLETDLKHLYELGRTVTKHEIEERLVMPEPPSEGPQEQTLRLMQRTHLNWLFFGKELDGCPVPPGLSWYDLAANRYLIPVMGFAQYRLYDYDRMPQTAAVVYRTVNAAGREEYLIDPEPRTNHFDVDGSLLASDGEFQDPFSDLELLKALDDKTLSERKGLVERLQGDSQQVTADVDRLLEHRQRVTKARESKREEVARSLELERELKQKREALEAELKALDAEG